jgi:integrase
MSQTRGFGRVYKRGKVWWIQYNHRGRTHRESSHSAGRTDAVKLLRKRHAEMGTGRLVGPDAERTTFEDLARMLEDDYAANGRRSLSRARLSIKHLRALFAESRVIDITPDRITAYVARRQEDKAAPATIRQELAALKRMLRLGLRAGKVSSVPYIPSLEVSNTRTGFFEEDQFEALRNELPAHLKAAMEFAYLTGWRLRSEVLTLTWGQVDFKAGVVRLEPGTTKNGEGRAFPFGALPALERLLRRQHADTMAFERDTGQIVRLVFHNKGKPIVNYIDVWHAACKRAAVRRIDGKEVVVRPELLGRIPHDFRRTAVRNLERAGVSRSVAMKLVGHKTESVYRRYAIVAESDLREGVGKLAKLGKGTGTLVTQSADSSRPSDVPTLVQAVAGSEHSSRPTR